MVRLLSSKVDLIILLQIILVLFLLGCSEKKDSNYAEMLSEYIDKALAKTSVTYALMDAEIRLRRNLYCVTSEAFKEAGMGQVATDNKNRCTLLTVAGNAIRPTLEIIRAGKVPASVYAFKALLPDDSGGDENLYTGLMIGPFSNIYECKRVELIARYFNIPVEACQTCKPTL